MRLKRLDIFAFKSFADKTSIEFSNGITGIVGPNGCGKTNIIEAIRWGLGEHNSRMIRAKKMEDVIFSGTKKRSPTSFSEVQITFEMKDDIPSPLGFHEITFKRRIKRDGVGEYSINQTSCLLRDISDALLNIGITSRSYSLFSQEAIDKILDEDSQVRREMLELVAGISKYQQQKSITLRRLEDTNADIIRLQDRIDEVGTALRRAKREARKALVYLDLKEEYKKKMLSFVNRRKHEIFNEKKILQDRSSELNRDKVKITSEIDRIQDRLIEVRREVEDIDKYYHELESLDREKTSDKSLIDLQIERKIQEIRSLKERKTLYQEDFDSINTKMPNIESSLVSLKKQREDIKADLKMITEEKRNITIKIQQHLDQIKNVKTSLTLNIDKSDILSKEDVELQNALASLNEKRSIKHEQQERMEEIIKLKDIEVSEITEKIKEYSNSLETITGEELKSEKQIEFIQSQIYKNHEKRNLIYDRLRDFKAEISALFSEKEMLIQHQDSLEGYESATKLLVKKYNYRPFGEMIHPDPGYELATEIALGFALQSVIVEEEKLSDILYEVENYNEGRGWAVLQREITEDSKSSTVPEHYFLSGYQKYDDKLKGTLSGLLDNWLVVDDKKALFTVKDDYPGFNIVSKDGYSVYKNMLFSSGLKKAGIVGRRQRIEQIGELIKQMNIQIESTENEMAVLDKDIEKSSENLDNEENILKAIIDRKSRISTELTNLQYHKKMLEETGLEEQRDQDKLIDEIKNLDERISGRRKRQAVLIIELEKYRVKVEEETIRTEELENSIQPHQKRSNELNVLIAKEGITYENLDEKILQLIENREDLEEKKHHLENKIKTLQNNLSEILSDHKKLEDKEKLIAGEQKKAEENLGLCAEKLTKLRNLERELEDDLNEKKDIRDKLMTRSEHCNVEIMRMEGEINSILSELKGSLGIGEDELEKLAEKEKESEENQISEEEVMNLKRKLDSYGHINFAAQEEFTEVKQRFDFLNTQKNDLLDTQKGLRESIAAIDRIAQAKFLDALEQVRKNYREIFFDMFNATSDVLRESVEADLLLEEGKDPLESDIRVVAIPPGKKLKSTRALSTGERTLTALCLLWALHQVRPSPLVVLDEFDAALDDANVERFIHFIKRIARESQVIMVTHNRRTMEFCQSLYGVTMEEAGVSLIVSVNLEKIDGIIGQNNSKTTQDKK